MDMTDYWWSEIRNLFQFAHSSPVGLDGQYACFELRLEGPAIETEDSVLIRARILQQLEGEVYGTEVSFQRSDAPASKVVLRMPYAIWNQVGRRCQTVRALWSQVRVQNDIVILDATVGNAFIAGDIVLQPFENIQVAEIFCGGFAGWSQAAWCLSDRGLKIRTAWLLDIDDDTEDPLKTMFPDLQVAGSASDILELDPDDGPFLLQANLEHSWWHQIWGVSAPQILTCSPPCQPWSTAGNQGGLDTPDGRLLLRLAAILKVVRVPVVCLEEVVGFAAHKDFQTVMLAWQEAGYRRVYESSLQLAEVCPTRRNRRMYIFVHSSVSQDESAKFCQTLWQPVRRPSLGGLRAIFEDLPGDLRNPCSLSPELLDVYLDPWFLPPGHGSSLEAARKFRLCTPAQQAKCFMACYHRQHTLPPRMLERGGILCSLAHLDHEIRFFAAPEIVSCHGAQKVQLLLRDDSTSMRILGNSLAVPQALLTLAHAVQFFPCCGKIDPAFAVHCCLQSRLHAGNSALFQVPKGWLLVDRGFLGQLLARKTLRLDIEHHMCLDAPAFHELEVVCRESHNAAQVVVRTAFFNSQIALPALCEALGLQVTGEMPMAAAATAGPNITIRVDGLTPLWLDASPCVRAQCGAPIQLCTSAGLVVVQPSVPNFFHQLKWAFDRCRLEGQPSVVCLSCFGTRLDDAAHFPPVTFVAGSANDIHFHSPCLDQAHVRESRIVAVPPCLSIVVPHPFAVNWWLQMPYHLLECLGWIAEADDFLPAQDEALHILLRPATATPIVPPGSLRLYLREVFFFAQLKDLATNPKELLVGPFHVQVDARSIGDVCLPGAITPDDIETTWQNACHFAGTWPGGRVFSGPRRLDGNLSLQELLDAGLCQIKQRNQLPMLTLMPEVRGGGVKDENTSFAKSKLASLLLDRGVPLAQTHETVDSLVPAIGTAACISALRQTDTQKQWKTLCHAAQATGLTLPTGDNRAETAAQRIQKAVRKQRLQQQAPVRASDFILEPDTWCGIDDQPVPILEDITADCSGVVLVDASTTNAQDLALLRNMSSEALCLVLPGHRCPDPDTCSGRTSVPVCHKVTGRRHLLAACYHNVGETDITPQIQHGTRVDSEDTVCCSFTMCQEDFPAEAQWKDCAAAPVRTVVEAFRTKGVDSALHHPWARTYRASGRPSQPHLCDQFVFYAKVPQGKLRAVLQCSGFNRVYVVPRSWDRQLLPGWAVVWLALPRSEIEKQALLVAEQHGLVKGKNKFGLRVPAASFRKVFTQLRPGDAVPDHLEISETFKVGPFPAAASADAIREWSKRMSWPTKVIKSLGPQFWLLGSASEPPAATMLFNNTPVLATAVKGRDQQRPVVQAGGHVPRDAKTTKTPAEAEDPWLHNDPWSSYKASHTPGPAKAASASTTPLDSSSATRLTQQDDRIAELERGLQQLRDEHAVANLERARDKAALQHDIGVVRADVQQLGTGLRQDFQAWTASLTNAQAQQDQQIATGMAELKALILASNENKRKQGDADLARSSFAWSPAPLALHLGCPSDTSCASGLCLFPSVEGLSSFSFPWTTLPVALPCSPPVAPSSANRLLVDTRACRYLSRCGFAANVDDCPGYWRPGLYSGLRIGEATNPGPFQRTLHAFLGQTPPAQQESGPTEPSCVFAVVNPTSILHKVPALLELGADIVALSETSAVQRAQQVTTNAFRRHGFKVHWGWAVQPHCRVESDKTPMRGLAAGVALAARVPSRASRPALPEAAAATCRISEAFVRLGALEVRVITVYGVALSEPDARERTNAILQQAFERASQNAVPCIVAGDFNLRPFDCPAGQAFQAQGYQDIFDLYKGRCGHDLPATCRGSTRHDTAILHPVIVRLWMDAWVVQQQLFDSHDPLCFRLRTCQSRPCTKVWRLPRALSQLGVDKAQFEVAFSTVAPALRRQIQECDSCESIGNAFAAFSGAAEDAADLALRRQHLADPVKCPTPGLSKAFRGRCLPRNLVHKEAACLCRNDRSGGYDPDVEVTSVLGRLKVRQVRRLVVFRRGLSTWRLRGASPLDRCRAQLDSEWRAIRRAKGYPPDFVQWTLNIACFHQFFADLPPDDWLDSLLEYVRYDCDCLTRQEAKRRRDNFLCQVSVDAEVGGSRQGFQAMRAAPNPPFTEVPCQVRSLVRRTMQDPQPSGEVEYALLGHGCFRSACPALLSSSQCKVAAACDGTVLLVGEDLPVEGELVQDYVACTAPELHSAFASFWGPLWQRDSGPAATSVSAWPCFQQLLARTDLTGPKLDIMCTPEQWQNAIRNMSCRKSTGICGWSPSDLKLLPWVAIDLLCLLFNTALPFGLPDHLLRARVCVLAKAFCPEHIKQSRPITIFCTLYRVWGSIVTKNLLRSWAAVFPRAVAGSMPGRSSRELSYKQQHWIELALLQGSCRFGFSLDIVKCFNQLGWPPLRLLLTRMGVPAELADFWFGCQSRLKRHTCFLNDLSEGIGCYNGAPEGDPFSVAALAVVCAFAESLCREPEVAFDMYVDNWSWSSLSSASIERAVPKAVLFLQSLSLPIDWTKSYTWATTAAGRKWWKQARDRVFPAGVTVPAVSEVRDLGVAFKFDGRAHAVSRSARLQDGIDRLARLRHQPRSTLLKASMVQRGVWPACLYGAEGHSFQLAELHRLRGRAARAIVGHHKVLSPFLALSALSDVCQDPQVYCLEQQLQLLRRTCISEPDVALSVIEVASSGCAKSCQGPATALRQALDRLELTITGTGVVKGGDNTWVDVTSCHAREIRLLLQRSWALHVQQQVSHRNGLGHAPPPDSRETGHLLSRLSSNEQVVLARHITGAFSSAAAKNLWDPEIPAECPLCGLKQTKEHKFLWCAALAHVREEHLDIIEELRSEHPSWIHAPYAATPPDMEINRLIFATRSLQYPKVDLPTGPLLQGRGFLRFFTDGSCRHPAYPEASHAGYAVILDTSLDDATLPAIMERWRETAVPPCEFRVVDQGLVPGLQSINRAELCAIIQAARIIHMFGSPPAVIWTDSAFAIAEWERAGSDLPGTWPDLAALLKRLYRANISLLKIASHQDATKLEGLQRWLAAGNEAADTAAKAAVLRDLDCVTATADQTQSFQMHQRRQLSSFWRYLLALSLEEAKLLKAKTSAAPLPVTSGNTDTTYAAWISLNSRNYISWDVPQYQREWLLACSWPPDYTLALWSWLRSLQWSVRAPHERATSGVTYVELLVHFVFTTGQCPPSRLVAPNVTDTTSDPMLVEPTTVRQLTHSLTEAVRQLERLSGLPLWPERRSKVFSLRTLGQKETRIGLNLRPFFDRATEMVKLLHQVVQQASVQPLSSFCRNLGRRPPSESTDLLRVWHCISTSERANMARSLRRCR
ncbi:unnamed protein product [Symbiodinium sp. CCMP2592]|nr:unnamed protein product [Symbiodinium sp. CCMP2592]